MRRSGLLSRVALALPLGAAVLSPGAALAAALPAWSAPSPADQGGTPSSIACVSRALCVAVDGAGHVLASTAPTANSPWEQVASDPHALTSVSCASARLCIAVDDAGQVLTSTDPAAAGSWLARPIDGTTSITAISCPTESLCVAVDEAGEAFTSTKPALSGSPWARAEIDSGHALTSVSCASAQLCVAVDESGAALASSEPAGVAEAWRPRAIDPTPPLVAVSCDAAGACVAVDKSGDALASSNPVGTAPTWSSTAIDPIVALTSISCAAFEVCIAVDHAGHAFVSEDAPAAVPTWTSSQPDPGAPLLSVSCAQDGFCAAIDGGGLVISTTVPAPPSSEPPPPPPPPSVSLVTPRPSISGVPAVGDWLVCNPGVPHGASATLAYAWWRDGSPIPGAGDSAYHLARADATHHLQCLVTASNAAGSSTGHSAFVAVPAQGALAAVGETTVGTAHAGGGRVEVEVRCSPRAAGVCAIALRLTVVREPHARRVTVTVGASGARLAPGRRRTVSVSLSTLGRRLLAHAGRLPAQLSVSGTVIGVLRAVLSRQRLTLISTPRARGGASASGSHGRASYTPTFLTPTPYMGWDTYFAFGPRYSESTVLAQASALLSDGLAREGYRYVWLDAGWWQGRRGSSDQIVVNRSQWPHGMAWLTRTLHAAGLLAGLYTDAGADGCGGAHEGSYGHYRRDADTFAAWGFDAVKVDFCGGARLHLDPAAAYSSFHAALQANSSHRPMLLSICNFLEPGQLGGGPPFAQSAFSSYTFGPSTGNSWRTDGDVGSPGLVTFAAVLRNLDADAAHPEAAGPGHWNDPDYLGPDQGLTDAQFRTQLSMWAMLAAPLMVSDNLQSISPPSRAALENPEVLAIDQDPAGAQGALVSSSGEGQAWAKPLSDGGRAVALLNRGSTPLRIETSASSVGMPAASRYLVRDAWAHTRYASNGPIAAEVSPESTVLLRIASDRRRLRP